MPRTHDGPDAVDTALPARLRAGISRPARAMGALRRPLGPAAVAHAGKTAHRVLTKHALPKAHAPASLVPPLRRPFRAPIATFRTITAPRDDPRPVLTPPRQAPRDAASRNARLQANAEGPPMEGRVGGRGEGRPGVPLHPKHTRALPRPVPDEARPARPIGRGRGMGRQEPAALAARPSLRRATPEVTQGARPKGRVAALPLPVASERLPRVTEPVSPLVMEG